MITVLGSSGFIGSHLVKKLAEKGIEYKSPSRGQYLGQNMGNIIYCIGLTADFRQKPFETVEAHVCLLSEILQHCEFESLTYLSSTRVYIKSSQKEVFEHSSINVSIDDPDELYTLTKLTGERLCLSSGKNAKIVRLSNVYGADYSSENFINDIIKKIKKVGTIKFFTTAASSKDYISIHAVTDLLIGIATQGKERVYNLASGENVSNGEIINLLKENFKFDYSFDENAKEIVFPKINIDKIKKEFDPFTVDNKESLSQLIKMYSYDSN